MDLRDFVARLGRSALREHKALKVRPVHKVRKDKPAPLALKGFRVTAVPQDRWAPKASVAKSDQPVRKGYKDLVEKRAPKAYKVFKDYAGKLVP